MLKRIAVFCRFLLIGLLVLIISFAFLFPQLFFCQLIGFSEFRQENASLFISPEINAAQLPEIRQVVSRSKMRIDSFYSNAISKPRIILCGNEDEYEKYCNNSEGAGCSLTAPWGSSFVIINSANINVDVVSHEMSHIELFTRLGWWTMTMEIPQWFNEGIALMLDKRFVNNPDPIGRYLDYTDEWLYYTRGGQEILELDEITSLKGFFGNPQESVMLSYMTSGLEVSYWLTFLQKNGLQPFWRDMNSGNSFKNSYQNMERQARNRHLPRLPANPLRLPESAKAHK